MFLSYCRLTGLAAELVRYADDFVILMRGGAEKTLAAVKQMLERMGLKLNEKKTRLMDARTGSLDYLGFTFSRKKSSKTGRVITLIEPSQESERYFRDEVRSLTARWTHCRPQKQVLEQVNRYVQGWVNYFYLYNSTRVFCRQRFFLEQRTRKYLQGRRQIKGFGYYRWPPARLYKEFKLCAIPVRSPYRQTRMP